MGYLLTHAVFQKTRPPGDAAAIDRCADMAGNRTRDAAVIDDRKTACRRTCRPNALQGALGSGLTDFSRRFEVFAIDSGRVVVIAFHDAVLFGEHHDRDAVARAAITS